MNRGGLPGGRLCGFLAAIPVLFLGGFAAADLPVVPVVLRGETVPGLPVDVFYSSFTVANIASSGEVTFTAFIAGPGVTSSDNTVVISEFGGGAALLAREGEAAPTGIGGETYDFISSPAINGSGTAGFRSTVAPSGFGIFRQNGAGVDLLARDGTPVTGVPGATLESQFNNRYPVDGNGAVYLGGTMAGGAVTNSDDNCLFQIQPGSVAIVAREGVTPVPGVPAADFQFFEFIDANASGDIAFLARLGGTSGMGDDQGIWIRDGGVLSLIAREGDPAPGLPGVTFGTIGSAVSLGDDGTVAFTAVLAGAGVTADNESTVWAGKPGALKLVAREGNAAPGTGLDFDDLVIGNYGDIGPSVSPLGTIAFQARVRGAGVTDADDEALWVQDGDGNLLLVVREGDIIPAQGGDRAIGTSNALFLAITLDPVGAFGKADTLIFTAETGGGSFDGVYSVAVPGPTPDAVRPRIRVKGPKRTSTTRSRKRIVGIASDNVGIDRVEVKKGRRNYRKFSGSGRWRYRARLKRGTNRFRFRAVDSSGLVSKPVRVRIIRH